MRTRVVLLGTGFGSLEQTTVRSFDPTSKKVVTDSGAFEADFLVVALGADLDPSATPELVEGVVESGLAADPYAWFL